MSSHSIQMHNTSFTSKAYQAMAVLVFGLASVGVQAHGGRGTEVDTTCFALNGTKPYASSSSATRCNLCHQDNRSVRREPEWTWVQAGSGANGQNNFCFVQGIIEKPTANVEISKGGTVDLAARGFSASKGVGAVTYTWNLSDGRTLSGGSQTAVPLSNAGNLVVSLVAKDSTGATDPTPDQRTINVTTTATIANGESYSVQSGTTLNVPAPGVLTNDSGTGMLKATLVGNVTQGVLTLNANGGFDYKPNAGFTGTDSFTYTASNGVVSSATATVTLTVTAAQTLAIADRYFVQPGNVLKIAAPGVLSNDTGTGALTASLVKNVSQGSLNLNPDGSFDYTPRASFTGTDSFTYSVSNSAGSSYPVKVSLDVGACTDKDNDGYSPEGGNCGPIDCNDNLASTNPSAREICSNHVDDDCNGLSDEKDKSCKGTDCISKLLDNQVKIDSASWSQDNLTISGSYAKPGSTVTGYDAVSGALLGSVTVDASGAWGGVKTIVGSANVPCSVRVEINGASGVRKVTGTTANCSSNNGSPTLSCGTESPQSVNDCLFNWAERTYVKTFAPAGQTTVKWSTYAYRFYPQTKSYLGVSSADNHVYYRGPDGQMSDVGPLSYWKPLAGCK